MSLSSPSRLRSPDAANRFQPQHFWKNRAPMIADTSMFLVSAQCRAVPVRGHVGINDSLPALARDNVPVERLLGLRDSETIARLHAAVRAALSHRAASVLVARTPTTWARVSSGFVRRGKANAFF